ncbi:hypothetical protein E2C01_017545 [Portunus trituberculatus]|uniref:Uncharacterized protein n=1 Tax=Portunus trituberculatus TaxID=210409 RepID=A0A5B7DU18_PORTR|nr:hypothetical protein [Portunus trituberculatus]
MRLKAKQANSVKYGWGCKQLHAEVTFPSRPHASILLQVDTGVGQVQPTQARITRRRGNRVRLGGNSPVPRQSISPWKMERVRHLVPCVTSTLRTQSRQAVAPGASH